MTKQAKATMTINPAENRYEAVTIVRRGTGILATWTRVERANGHRVWVPNEMVRAT